MANHEDRPIRDKVNLFLAFKRKKLGNDSNECIRIVIKDYDRDLALLEYKCRLLGGTWRIHHTVNARDTEKARLWLIHKLIDNPKFAGCIDSIWKTALLQSECKTDNYFMFDIDTKENNELSQILDLIPDEAKIGIIKTPNGHHLVTKQFDTRKICNISNVTLIRDGYFFIKEINEKE